VFARLLEEEGICVVTEDTVESCKPSVEHPVAIVLGSGLGHLAQLVKPVRRVDYHDIDGFPQEARPISGHKFEATIGTIDEVPVVVYPGRVHLYQGYSAAEVTSLVRHAHHLGCRDVIFACATGCIPGNAHKGLGILTDQINLTGRNPLAEWDHVRELDTPFVGMADAYTPYLRTLARGVADDAGITVEEGVYAGMLGPTFETPAEVAMLKGLGVSYVGMSTVCEVIMAHALGMNVLGLTLAANECGDPTVTHQSVLEEADRHADDFERLVRGVLHLL
jgi:purine-nucleoside phosphorylase